MLALGIGVVWLICDRALTTRSCSAGGSCSVGQDLVGPEQPAWQLPIMALHFFSSSLGIYLSLIRCDVIYIL